MAAVVPAGPAPMTIASLPCFLRQRYNPEHARADKGGCSRHEKHIPVNPVAGCGRPLCGRLSCEEGLVRGCTRCASRHAPATLLACSSVSTFTYEHLAHMVSWWQEHTCLQTSHTCQSRPGQNWTCRAVRAMSRDWHIYAAPANNSWTLSRQHGRHLRARELS